MGKWRLSFAGEHADCCGQDSTLLRVVVSLDHAHQLIIADNVFWFSDAAVTPHPPAHRRRRHQRHSPPSAYSVGLCRRSGPSHVRRLGLQQVPDPTDATATGGIDALHVRRFGLAEARDERRVCGG
jgi:hypothetical protein